MRFLIIHIILCLPTSFILGQFERTHSVQFEFSNPTLFSAYPKHGQIYKLGYEWKRKKDRISLGFDVYSGFNIFQAYRPSRKDNRLSIRNYGGGIDIFSGLNITHQLTINTFIGIGTYYTNFVFYLNGSPMKPALFHGAITSFTAGIGLDYEFNQFIFSVKFPYDKYQNAPYGRGSTIYNEPAGLSPILVNGFNPSIGIGYIFKQNKKD